MSLTQEQKVDFFNKQHQLWETVRQVSRDQIGPVNNPEAPGVSMPEFQDHILEVVNDLSASPFVDYQFDGTKTSTIIADTFYNFLRRGDLTQAALDLQAIIPELVERLGRQGLSFSLDEVNARTQIAVEGLDGWLREQSIEPQASTPLMQSTPFPAVDARYPFVVYRRDQDGFALTEHQAYWSGRGLSALLIQDDGLMRDESQWDGERLQVTLRQPYLLLCNGVLRGGEWGESIAARIRREGTADAVVIILADGIAEDTPRFEDVFTSVILPAPNDQELADGAYIPRRPIMERMGELFGARVVNLWVEPSTQKKPEWGQLGDALGRCEAAQVDRHRSVLVASPERGGIPDGNRRDEWFPLRLHTLTLPLQTSETLAKAEMLLRKRVEMADGVVAGGCAALYWLAGRLEADTHITNWVREALRAPMLQILKNAGMPPESEQAQRIGEWVSSAEFPTQTFFIDERRAWVDGDHSFEVIDNDYPVLLGDARDLGIISPLPQITRISQESLRAGFELAFLYSGM